MKSGLLHFHLRYHDSYTMKTRTSLLERVHRRPALAAAEISVELGGLFFLLGLFMWHEPWTRALIVSGPSGILAGILSVYGIRHTRKSPPIK